jgi:putative peptide zinc metalloprotease protein
LRFVLLILLVPWSGRVSAPAIVKAESHMALYAPSSAILAEILVAEGQSVEAGTMLARLDNPDLALRRQQVERRIGVLKYELSAIGFEDSFRSRAQSITQELAGAVAERAAIQAETDRLTLVAPMAATITDISPNLQPGQWINGREPVLGLRAGTVLEAYVAESDLPRIAQGSPARFIPEGGGKAMAATIAAIDRVAVKALTEPSLAAPYGGTIPARFADKTLVPDGAIYRVRLIADTPSAFAAPIRGQVHMDGQRQSLMGATLRSAAAVLIREWGF